MNITTLVAGAVLYRGDVVECRTSTQTRCVWIWRYDGRTLTEARGWRLWYLRLLYNPARRAANHVLRLPRFVVDACVMLWDGANVKDAASAGWRSSRWGA